MRRLTFIMLLLSLCLILSSATLAQSPPDDEDTCQDAAGAPVPCPTDEPRPTEAPQPEQPQPQLQPEQPEPPSGTESEQPQPEQPEPDQPDSAAVNPLRPSATGECQLATFGVVRVNVRQSPAFDAPVIGVLVPDTLYAVDSIFVSGGETWLGVAGGWVHGSTVVYNGDCPVQQVEVIRANYRVILEPLPEPSDEGSVFPSQQCIELFDGTIFCYQTLLAIPSDGTDTSYVPPQHLPSGCWFEWPGGNTCTTLAVPGGNWDPQPPSFPSIPSPPPSPPDDDGDNDGDGDDEGIPYCYDQSFLRGIISPDDQSGYSVLEGNMISLGFLKAPGPGPQPEPCRFNAPIIRFDEPADDGSYPLDIVQAIIQWPPPMLDDETSPLIPIVHMTPTQVVYLDTIRIDDGGDFCAPTAPHGFENCPDDDDATTLDYQLFSSLSVGDPFLLIEGLSIAPDPGDTEYTCSSSETGLPVELCNCKGVQDCLNMKNRACSGSMTCGGLFGNKCQCYRNI